MVVVEQEVVVEWMIFLVPVAANMPVVRPVWDLRQQACRYAILDRYRYRADPELYGPPSRLTRH